MNMTDFGEKLSKHRQNQNMTQEELAMRICVTPQAVSRWERNQSLPDITMVADICRILNISADYLLNVESGQVSEDNNTDSHLPIMKILRNCDEPIRLQFGKGLLKLFMEDAWGELVSAQRIRLAAEGILLPIVKIMDQFSLEENEFQIVSYQRILYKETIEEITEHTCKKITEKLGNVVRENYAHILNAQIVKTLTDNLKIAYPAQIEGVIPEKIPYGLLLDILRHFIGRGNSMLHLMRVIEYTEHALRAQPELTAEELAKGAEEWLTDTTYKEDAHPHSPISS